MINREEKKIESKRFWIGVAVGFVVALISSASSVPFLIPFLGALIAGGIANGARRGGPAGFLTMLFSSFIVFFVIPSLGVSTGVFHEVVDLPASIALVFALGILGLPFGLIGGLLGRIIYHFARPPS